ncbi:hypothetical protein ZEAMMB73_Zm00001d040876 [Zea mays]|uniref:Uncharacterized protein n=1 Tax=Zea mays TaxID=4577 RepID=A0A1D6MTF9_MAIZE|nr:hypothetical protein ZEAMMB73_Zm00001d040876 [Zea mays]
MTTHTAEELATQIEQQKLEEQKTEPRNKALALSKGVEQIWGIGVDLGWGTRWRLGTLRWVVEEESEGGRRGCLAEPRGEGERHLQGHNLGETATMSVPHGRRQDLELAIDDFDEELIDPELRYSFQRNSKSIQQTLALLTYRNLFGIAIRLPVMLLRDRRA